MPFLIAAPNSRSTLCLSILLSPSSIRQALLHVSGRLVSKDVTEKLDKLHGLHKEMAGWALDGGFIAGHAGLLLSDLRALREVRTGEGARGWDGMGWDGMGWDGMGCRVGPTIVPCQPGAEEDWWATDVASTGAPGREALRSRPGGAPMARCSVLYPVALL